jgi:hypothetical protein
MAFEIGMRRPSNYGVQNDAVHWRSAAGSFAIRQGETAKKIEDKKSVPGELIL